jgi:hypothetical protein
MKLHRWLQPLFLALVLLFAQHSAALHALSHAFQGSGTQQEQHLPGAKACSQCMILAEIEGAVLPGHPPFVPLVSSFVTYYFTPSFSPLQLVLGFLARAPPYFL